MIELHIRITSDKRKPTKELKEEGEKFSKELNKLIKKYGFEIAGQGESGNVLTLTFLKQ